MIKNWRTTLVSIVGATTLLATSKGWIDTDIAAYIGSVVVIIFGVTSKDFNQTGK